MDKYYAEASEKYVPDWSLVNKDRIINALSAKMSLFHLGTPAEHFCYRRVSEPELGNALMLNQAQSNSLVVETYKRWVEAESNYRRYEREVAYLKIEENIRSKTKQELASLRAQVDHLKAQVSETREINKASQASATAAFEARDKAVQDLESLRLKFGELEKKLSEFGEGSKSEQKRMQSSYDQLLADHIRVGDDWVVRACVGASSYELEKVVADLVNNVNDVGMNDEIKQGFQAAKTSYRAVSELPGYDEGAKDVLEAAIVAFDNFHISVLSKVADFVNEPLVVTKEKRKLPVVKED
ncbi:hypothetical protein Hdeb2414_s0015g00452161 [Helianthus debilis subsp. tardiflorus]